MATFAVGTPHAGLEVGEGEQPLARGHLVEKRRAAAAVPTLGDQRTRAQRGVQHRFRRQPAADLGQHHLHLDLTAGVLVETESEDADLGELLPHVAAPAEFGVDRP